MDSIFIFLTSCQILKSYFDSLHLQYKSLSLPHNIKNEIVMSIKKQFVKTKPVCKVTFSVVAKEATTASVVGDFNNWNAAIGELSKLKNGSFKGVFDLPKDATYEFKYVIDGVYVNEPEADSLKWNDFAGEENGVLVL